MRENKAETLLFHQFDDIDSEKYYFLFLLSRLGTVGCRSHSFNIELIAIRPTVSRDKIGRNFFCQFVNRTIKNMPIP
jgi:hypothetical protein